MNKTAKLPDIRRLELVSFHVNHKRNYRKIVMLVPEVDDANEYKTYEINLDNPSEYQYIVSLKMGDDLISKLQMYANVAYMPKNGNIVLLEAGNEKGANRFRELIADAHREHQKNWKRTIANRNETSALWRWKQKRQDIP